MSVSGTYEVGSNIKSFGFYLKIHLVKGIIGGNAKNSGKIRVGEECLAVIYHGCTHGGLRGKILRYIANR